MTKVYMDMSSRYQFCVFKVNGFSKSDSHVIQDIELLEVPQEEYLDHEMTKKCCEVMGKADGHELGYGVFNSTHEQVQQLLNLFNSKEEIRDLDYQFEILGR